MRGLTRELRIRRTTGTLVAADVAAALVDEGGRPLEGVQWRMPRQGEVATVITRDERHRQEVLRQAKVAIRERNMPLKVACWLSPLQRQNKGEVYKAVGGSGGRLTALDWSDRVLVIREPTPEHRDPARWVVNTDLPPEQLGEQLRN